MCNDIKAAAIQGRGSIPALTQPAPTLPHIYKVTGGDEESYLEISAAFNLLPQHNLH